MLCEKNKTIKSKLHEFTYKLLWNKIENSISKQYVLDNLVVKTGLSYSWLDYFSRNLGGSPSVDRVELLYNELSGKQLKF